MLGLVTTAMVVAQMVSPLIGGLLLITLGWEAIFVFVALLSGIVFTWALIVLPETHPPGPGQSARELLKDWRELIQHRKFYGYIFCAALTSAPFYTAVGGAPHVIVTLMHRTPAEYGMWFALGSLGYMSGNFTVSRLSERFGVDILIAAGIAVQIFCAAISLLLVLYAWELGPFIIFGPQFLISYGNGLALPTSIAVAVSIRPHAAGSASGLTGFTQTALGAIATQGVSFALVGAVDAMPMAWMMLAVVVLGWAAYVGLVRR